MHLGLGLGLGPSINGPVVKAINSLHGWFSQKSCSWKGHYFLANRNDYDYFIHYDGMAVKVDCQTNGQLKELMGRINCQFPNRRNWSVPNSNWTSIFTQPI
jgi:hypothetical protein